ncbi:MAG TPA: MarC family protein [Pyrinomonadaceae bacterium]|nr:MarC family protein [Pyrinomonadaceae bacterium]
MSGALLQFGLTAFVTLLVVVDPFGVVPIFAGLTRGMSTAERRNIVTRAVIISLGVTIFFLLAGRAVLSHLGVTVHAFGISGGILLFATALPMLFGQRPGLQAPERDEHGTAGEDIAIFPLAIPLLSGPGTIATVLLLSTQTGGGASSLIVLAAAILFVYIIALVVLHAGDRLMSRVGEGKVHILTRVMGIILAALAVQYVLNGITGYYNSLIAR